MTTAARLGRWLAGAGLACLSAAAPAAGDAARGQLPATGTVEVAFSPWDDTEGAVLRTIESARREVLVQAFLLTSRRVARALMEARARGVAVQVLADREMTVKGGNSQIPALAAAGIPVALEVRYPAAHNKIILVDPRSPNGAVLTGSFNFTYAAGRRNAENVVIMRGNEAVMQAYLANWRRHRADAQPYADAVRPVR